VPTPSSFALSLRCLKRLLQDRCDDYGKGNLDQEGFATALWICDSIVVRLRLMCDTIGIAAFFSKHQCNAICEHLRIGRCVQQKFGLGTLAPSHAKPAVAGGFKQSPQVARFLHIFVLLKNIRHV
jgi:hypothetical protein